MDCNQRYVVRFFCTESHGRSRKRLFFQSPMQTHANFMSHTRPITRDMHMFIPTSCLDHVTTEERRSNSPGETRGINTSHKPYNPSRGHPANVTILTTPPTILILTNPLTILLILVTTAFSSLAPTYTILETALASAMRVPFSRLSLLSLPPWRMSCVRSLHKKRSYKCYALSYPRSLP